MDLFIPIGYGISAAALLLWTRTREESKSTSRLSLFFGVALLLFGLYPRVSELSTTSYGLMMFEELSASLSYVDKMASGVQTWTGATQMFYFLAMDLWRLLFGMEAVVARSLSAVFGLGSLIFLFLGFRRLVSTGAALLASGLMAWSLYGSYFSRLAIEPGWTIFFFALNIYFFARIREGLRGYFLLGLSVALGIFTYPGYTIWLLSAVPFIAFAIRKEWRSLGKPAVFLLAGFALFAVPTLIFHFVEQGDAPLFRGGGILFAEQFSYFQSVAFHFTDIFVHSYTYYLIFQDSTFLESTLWGFFLVGVWRLVWRERRAWAAVLLGAMLVLPFISATATNFPGMRRALLVLPTYYLFAAVGIDLIFRGLSQPVWKATAGLITAAALALPAYALVNDLKISAAAQPFDKWAEVIQHPLFTEWLQKFPVRIVMENPEKFPADYLPAYVSLLKRYRNVESDFKIITPAEPAAIDTLRPGVREFWIFANLPFAQKLMLSGKVCMYQVRRLNTKFYPMFATEIELRGDRKVCP